MSTKFMSTFCGQRISDYGRQNGSVDYAALARSFDAVLCNEIVNTHLWEDADLVSARPDHTERLEEIADRLEELERLTEEKESDKEDIEDEKDSIEMAIADAYTAMEKLERALYEIDEAGDYIEGLPDYEGPDSWDIRSEVESAYDDLTDYTTEQEEARDELDEKLEKLEKKLEKLEKEQNELESEQEELEAEQDYIAEVFQWYIISDEGAHILEQYLPYEVIYYVPALDVYVWGVCHYGTSWTHVLTGIPCETYDEERQRLEEYAAEEQELEQERMERETEAVRQEAEQTAKIFADILEQELDQSR